MSSQEDFPARGFQRPDLGPEQKMTVISGRNISAQLTSVTPIGLLAKMLLESSRWKINPAFTGMYSLKWKIVKLPDFIRLTSMKRYIHDRQKCLSIVSVKVLKKEDMKSKRLLFRLQVSKLHIKENESGLLPTPTAMMPGDQDMDKLDKRREKQKSKGINGNGFGPSLVGVGDKEPITNSDQVNWRCESQGRCEAAGSWGQFKGSITKSVADGVGNRGHKSMGGKQSELINQDGKEEGINADPCKQRLQAAKQGKLQGKIGHDKGGAAKQLHPSRNGDRRGFHNFPTQSPICSGNDGLSNRLDGITFPSWRNESLKASGNSMVPHIPFEIFTFIEKIYYI